MQASFFINFTVQVEYMLIKFNDDEKTAKLSLRAVEILKILNEKETEDPK